MRKPMELRLLVQEDLTVRKPGKTYNVVSQL